MMEHSLPSQEDIPPEEPSIEPLKKLEELVKAILSIVPATIGLVLSYMFRPRQFLRLALSGTTERAGAHPYTFLALLCVALVVGAQIVVLWSTASIHRLMSVPGLVVRVADAYRAAPLLSYAVFGSILVISIAAIGRLIMRTSSGATNRQL